MADSRLRIAVVGCGNIASPYGKTLAPYEMIEMAGATDALLERSGVVVVEVDDRAEALVAALALRSLRARLDDGTVEVSVDGDGDLDVIRDTVVDLGLPLHRLSTRVGTLDDVFLQRAQATPA